MRKTKFGVVYESLDELLDKDVEFANEDASNYYIRLKPEGDFDNRMWQVDKKTGKVTSIFMTVFFSFESKTRRVDIEKLQFQKKKNRA